MDWKATKRGLETELQKKTEGTRKQREREAQMKGGRVDYELVEVVVEELPNHHPLPPPPPRAEFAVDEVVGLPPPPRAFNRLTAGLTTVELVEISLVGVDVVVVDDGGRWSIEVGEGETKEGKEGRKENDRVCREGGVETVLSGGSGD